MIEIKKIGQEKPIKIRGNLFSLLLHNDINAKKKKFFCSEITRRINDLRLSEKCLLFPMSLVFLL
jgi:hypothetical protein